MVVTNTHRQTDLGTSMKLIHVYCVIIILSLCSNCVLCIVHVYLLLVLWVVVCQPLLSCIKVFVCLFAHQRHSTVIHTHLEQQG